MKKPLNVLPFLQRHFLEIQVSMPSSTVDVDVDVDEPSLAVPAACCRRRLVSEARLLAAIGNWQQQKQKQQQPVNVFGLGLRAAR
ncbi:hypothetical protein AWZ03_009504 [Drosophila navojoa]|uniref:Uncharacterized protein n=1 Tax=Drosophila navojoa TaxID=7232 RepID=A0A484B604_DRONA|nr:hypothetical protein AWZ03_009504 [Drosophila navojoa]